MSKYQEDVARTESRLEELRSTRRVVYPNGSTMTDIDFLDSRLLHAAMGLCTEAGEFMDVIKKHVYYGKPLDTRNLIEEAGDLLWYLATACNALGVDMNDVMDANIRKLRARYPEKFTAAAALDRDIDREMDALKWSGDGPMSKSIREQIEGGGTEPFTE